MKWRRALLWTVFLTQSLVSGVIVVGSLADGLGLGSPFFSAAQSVLTWLASGGEAGVSTNVGRFLTSYWWLGVMLLILANYLISVLYAAFDVALPAWRRAVWVVALWLLGLLLIPVYCL